jgi:molecular chaperone GrpE (heat shock protein)
MPDGINSTLPKWPFYAADILLSAIAVYVLHRLGKIEGTGGILIAIAALIAAAWAAWLSILPWITEYRDATKQSETVALAGTLEQIKNLQQVGNLIGNANAQWQTVQDSANRTVNAAREIADKMKAETDEFMKFLQNANDQEKGHLRLEIEKWRKSEADFLQVTVRMLDHIFALHQAGSRSGQANLITQLDQFQNACRDAARRIGLLAFAPNPGEPFDARSHQLVDPGMTIPDQAHVGQVLATGYTYQGQLLRRALVTFAGEEIPSPPTSEPEPEAEFHPHLPLA